MMAQDLTLEADRLLADVLPLLLLLKSGLTVECDIVDVGASIIIWK